MMQSLIDLLRSQSTVTITVAFNVSVIVLIVCYVGRILLYIPEDKAIPVVGIPKGLFGHAIAVYNSISHGDAPIAEGYKKVCTINQLQKLISPASD
jgi:hypothetical protein